jgi:hypothetical protein
VGLSGRSFACVKTKEATKSPPKESETGGTPQFAPLNVLAIVEAPVGRAGNPCQTPTFSAFINDLPARPRQIPCRAAQGVFLKPLRHLNKATFKLPDCTAIRKESLQNCLRTGNDDGLHAPGLFHALNALHFGRDTSYAHVYDESRGRSVLIR